MFENCWQKYEREIGTCLNTPQTVSVDFYDHTLALDYRILRISTASSGEHTPPKTFLRIAGIGCGWEWDEVGIFLAALGHTVIYLSWPGTGNSSDPPAWYYQYTHNFSVEAGIGIKVIDRLIRNGYIRGRVIPVAHSMGCEIAAQMHHDRPDLFEGMVFLAPSGLRHLSSRWWGALERLSLWIRFGIAGSLHRIEWKVLQWSGRHTPYEVLAQYVPLPRSSFSKDRRPQRKSEFIRNCLGNLPKIIATSKTIPLLIIWGTRDIVVPFGNSRQLFNDYAGPQTVRLIKNGWHNITLGPRSEQTAALIDECFPS